MTLMNMTQTNIKTDRDFSQSELVAMIRDAMTPIFEHF